MEPEAETPNAVVETVTAVSENVAQETRNLFHIDELKGYFTGENCVRLIASAIAVISFVILFRVVKKIMTKQLNGKVKPDVLASIMRTASYTFYAIVVMYVLSVFGVDLKGIWGAAGVAGIAVGFAAQTSISNIISGLFVLSEKALKIDDYVTIGDVSGNVAHVGLLSVSIKTLDNQLVRVPNSSIISDPLINYSHFPIRRMVFEIPVSFREDLQAVLDVMRKVPSMCPSALTDPAPVFFYDSINSYSVVLKIAVWIKREHFVNIKNEMYIAVTQLCKENNIEIPFERQDVKLV